MSEHMHSADLCPATTILASVEGELTSRLGAPSRFDAAVEKALDRAFGPNGWFLYWDEDLRGQPIRGTVSLAFGRETLIVA